MWNVNIPVKRKVYHLLILETTILNAMSARLCMKENGDSWYGSTRRHCLRNSCYTVNTQSSGTMRVFSTLPCHWARCATKPCATNRRKTTIAYWSVLSSSLSPFIWPISLFLEGGVVVWAPKCEIFACPLCDKSFTRNDIMIPHEKKVLKSSTILLFLCWSL